jgi:putative aldouronate transport system substrate-binding protein
VASSGAGTSASSRGAVSVAGSPASSAGGASGAASKPAGSAGTTTPAGASAPAKPGAGGAFPTYIPLQGGPKPDYPAPGPQYTDGFDNFPAKPAKVINTPPGKGGNVTFMTIALFPSPNPFDQNPAWKAVNQALNANVQFNIVSPADYATKLATTMAGGDLPDGMFLYAGPGITSSLGVAPGTPQFVETQAADLTPYLAGDAIKDYPNLAALPTIAWKNSGSVYDNKVFMVPYARTQAYFLWLKNIAMYDGELGKDYTPKNGDDLKRVLKALTKPQQNVYAIASAIGGAGGLTNFAPLFGAPNNWALGSDGKLTKDWETPQYKEATGYVRDLWASGVYHPNSLNYASGVVARTDFAAGRFAIFWDSFGLGWADGWRRALSSKNDIGMIAPFSAHDGAKPEHFTSTAFLGATMLKKGSPDRLKEMLAILNYLAVPFGSAEDLLLEYGVKDTDYKLDDKGNPIPTDRGNADANYVPWKYVAYHTPALYAPDIPGYAKRQTDAEKLLAPYFVNDPTVGYVSNTQFSKGITLNKTVTDGLNDIVIGRRPLTDYDGLVQDWLKAGGEQIRKEYQDAVAAAK